MPTILITGGHAGIGFECCKQLVRRGGYDLLLGGRSLERMQGAAGELRARSGVKVDMIEVDTSSLASVRAAAARCGALIDSGEIAPLQTILCNAGAQFRGSDSYTIDGYEKTFATNYLGHFLLVELLLDRVAKDGRIVFTASGTHDPDTPDGKFVGIAAAPNAIALANDGKDGTKPLSGGVRYTTSKLCVVLNAYELDRRLKQSGSAIASIAYDPGSVPDTGLLAPLPKPVQWLSKTSLVRSIFRRRGITMGSLDFSGDALARIAVEPAFAGKGGCYFQANDGRLVERRSSVASYDEAVALKLWRDAEMLTRLTPGERPATLTQASDR